MNKIKKYILSIIITTYNDEKEISMLFDDIFKQSLKADEIIVADGGSTDRTLDIVRNYNSNIPIKIVGDGKRLNISQGLNVAIRASSGEYIAIMMTGNRYESIFLKNLVSIIFEKKVDLAYASVKGKIVNWFSNEYNNEWLKNVDHVPSNHGILVKRVVFEKIGLYYEDFVYAGEDAEFNNRFNEANFTSACGNTSIEWTVPRNFKELNKQCKNYIIASMQINSSLRILPILKRPLLLFLSIIIMAISCISKTFWLLIIALFCLIISIVRIQNHKLIGFIYLIVYNQIYSLLMFIKYRKYKRSDFTVDKTRIPFL